MNVEITNGSGWNNYQALRTLDTLPIDTLPSLLAANAIDRLEIGPRDSERPLGIAARYFDAEGELVFSQYFDQNDSAEWIQGCVTTLLTKGVRNVIEARRREINREAAISRITAWRRNFDANFDFNRGSAQGSKSANKLRAKIGQWREKTGKFSRKECWNFTHKILSGEMAFAAVREKFFGKI